jgi:hypothetical protein
VANTPTLRPTACPQDPKIEIETQSQNPGFCGQPGEHKGFLLPQLIEMLHLLFSIKRGMG